MKIVAAAFSDYFQALAVPPQSEKPRPMRDMEEAFAFHAEMRGMPETLRLDFTQSGCNHRAELISRVLVNRRYQHGQATMAFDYDHDHTFECAAYSFVETEQGLQKVVFNPLREEPELWPAFEQRCVDEGYRKDWSIISDNMGGKRPPELILERLHSEVCDPAAP